MLSISNPSVRSARFGYFDRDDHLGHRMFVMSLTFGCQALTMVLKIFHPISEVDESFICVQRLYEVVDGTFVYHRVTLVSACLSCNEC